MKTLLVLGAGPNQIPLIETSVALNFNTIVIAPGGAKTEMKLPKSVTFHDVNLQDKQKCLQIASNYTLDGVVSTGSDLALPPWSLIASTLGLAGPSIKSADLSLNKIKSKHELNRLGVPTARMVSVIEKSGLKEEIDVSLPLFLKVSNSSGSRGVFRIESVNELRERFERVSNEFPDVDLFVEECIEGEEFGCQAWFQNGELIRIYPHNDQVLKTSVGTSVPVGHSMPLIISRSCHQQIWDIALKCGSAYDMNTGAMNLDLILDRETVFLIEAGARMGATGIPEMLGAFYECNFFKILIDEALSLTPLLPLDNSQLGVATRLVISESDAIINNLSTVKSNERFCSIQLDVMEGDLVSQFVTGNHRIGLVLTCAETEQEAIESAKNCAESIARQILKPVN